MEDTGTTRPETGLRRATAADAGLIAHHRHSMFRDNLFAADEVLRAMDDTFEPWVRERLADGRYVGFLLERNGAVIAGAGVFFCDFPPHWRHPEPVRAYLLNVYTEPSSRGQGLAKQLVGAILRECRGRGVRIVTLHASPQGRPLYEALGFESTDEMMLAVRDDIHGEGS